MKLYTDFLHANDDLLFSVVKDNILDFTCRLSSLTISPAIKEVTAPQFKKPKYE